MKPLLVLGLIFWLLGPMPPCRAQQYATDQPDVTARLNDYWLLQGLAQPVGGITPHWTAVYNPADWFEWNSLKIDWTSDSADKNAQRGFLENALIDGVNAKGTQAKGYIWPANNSELWIGVQDHFDQMPRLICAVYNDYLWSGDNGFLRTMQPKMEAVMGYLMGTMRAQDGLPQTPGVYDGRANHGPNTTYMDCYREGGTVTWIAESFYTALQDMAAMERILGDPARADGYTQAARRFPALFDRQLWNPATGRYAGWRDSGGIRHDYGFTYLNLEALARGLGDADKAYTIFHWLDDGTAQPTVAGGHVGSTDIYQCVVAPRSNTETIPAKDWDPWSVSPALRRSPMGYGALVEDGGALLWVNYYDVMARLKWLDADSAWDKLDALLRRVAGDPLHFTEDVTHPTNIYGENYLEVGPADGSENGIAGVTPLTGFMGVQARLGGLFVAPDLPTSLLRLSCDGVCYHSTAYSLQVSRGREVAEAEAGQSMPILTADAPFDTLLVRQTPPGTAERITLQKRIGTGWKTVAAASMGSQETDGTIPVSEEPPGTYRLLTDAAGGCRCALAQEPLARTGGGSLHGSAVAFTAPKAFSRIEFQKSAQAFAGATLLRQMGAHWRKVTATWSSGMQGGVLAFADQRAGSYRLEFHRPTSGTYTLWATTYTVAVRGKTAWSASVRAGQSISIAAAISR